MATMRCAVVREHGGIDAVSIEERPVPEPAADQVLVKVKAAGMNYEIHFKGIEYDKVDPKIFELPAEIRKLVEARKAKESKAQESKTQQAKAEQRETAGSGSGD